MKKVLLIGILIFLFTIALNKTMNKNGSAGVIIVTIIFIIVAVLGGRLILKKRSGNQTASPSPVSSVNNPCLNVPADYKSQCGQFNSWLDQKLVEWKPEEYKPMDFAAYHTLASFPNVRNTDVSLLQGYTSGLEESGADTIAIYMDGTPFLKNDTAIISKWDAVTTKIKSDNKKLYIVYIPDVKGSNLNNWETYKSIETNAIREIIKKYSPDSFVVLNEPSTVERELSFKPTADQWAALANDSADLVRSLNSKTKINIQITGNDLPYFDSLIKGKNIDGVGFNIYGFRAFDTFMPYIASVKNAGKIPMLSETWKMFKGSKEYDGMDSMDSKWVRVAIYYAQANGMSYVNPFFTFYFFLSPAEVRDQQNFLVNLGSNIAGGKRTESFIEYQEVINEAKGVPKKENPVLSINPTASSRPAESPVIVPVANGNPCEIAPLQYKSQCEQLNSWLDEKLVDWKTSINKPVQLAAFDVFASDDQFVKTNIEFDMKFLNMLEQTDSNIFILYIRPNSYFSQKQRYDTLINKIRADGKKLFIGARFDDVKMSFGEYDKQLTDYTNNIIAVLKPDYYGLVIEPTTMERKHGFDVTDEEWVQLIKKNVELSKKLSPNTKTAVGGHKLELNFLKLASSLDLIDIIGFNIYGMSGIDPSLSSFLGKGDVVGNSIDLASSKGKETWILETWVTEFSGSPEKAKIGRQEFMKEIDAKWVQVISYYAQRHNMKVAVPFYTGKFVTYADDPNVFLNDLNANDRTPVFYEYRSIIEEFRNNAR